MMPETPWYVSLAFGVVAATALVAAYLAFLP